jgi:hypothetical protein
MFNSVVYARFQVNVAELASGAKSDLRRGAHGAVTAWYSRSLAVIWQFLEMMGDFSVRSIF